MSVSVSVRSDEGEDEDEELRCLLVARLKVCSVTERGSRCDRTSSSWLARGVGGGGQLVCDWRRLQL